MSRLVAGAPLLATVLAIALAIGPLALAVALALHAVAFPLLGVAHTLLRLARTLLGLAGVLFSLATALVVHGIERHVAGSFSRSCAASSGAMRPSASSRRISLRRSASRSGSACDGKPSARITASRRDRTVG